MACWRSTGDSRRLAWQLRAYAMAVTFAACTGVLEAAATIDITAPEVEVLGTYETGVDSSDAASQGTVTARRIETGPALRPGEVLEYIPGLVITQHSGDGKANQYFLRGFNLDHGTDFSINVAGMPVNMPTHAHGQGYADLNFLIPELVSAIDYRKGPYYAEVGDFSSAGAADIHYASSLPHSIDSVTLGEHDYKRALLAGSPNVGGGTLLYGIELMGQDGPWDNPENFRKLNTVLRYSRGDKTDGIAITAWHTRRTGMPRIRSRNGPLRVDWSVASVPSIQAMAVRHRATPFPTSSITIWRMGAPWSTCTLFAHH